MALPTASDNLFPKVIIRESANDGSDFSNPTADYRVLFVGEDGLFHLKDSAGAVTTPTQGGYAPGGTDVAVADGGTGASSASAARTNLGISAANTPFTPNGSIAATDVQAAIQEVRDEATGGGSITVSENHLTADTTLTQDTYGDGPSLSLAAGTYLIDGHVEVTTVATGWIAVKLMNGATAIDAAEGYQPTGTAGLSMNVSGYVVLGGTTTVKIQAAVTSATGGTIRKTPATNATGLTDLVSYLRAVKIA